MTEPQINKKEQAYKLFARGFKVSSPEVKALGLKGHTRYNYFRLWENAGRPGDTNSRVEDELIPRGTKPLSEAALLLKQEDSEPAETDERDDPSGDDTLDVDDSIDIMDREEDPLIEDSEAGEEQHAGGKNNGHRKVKDNRKLGTMVAGQGITITVTLALKTLTLYQYAATLNKGELTLGDFLDTCVEDYYKGRGLDLGLVEIGGDGKNG